MSLITEDGTGLATAESLISVTDCDTHHAARGNSTWATITTAQKEQALRRATEYMIQVYTTRWQGVRTYPETQALDWPRTGVSVDGVSIDYNIVPVTVERACAELALRAAAGPLLDDITQGVTSEKVGVIEVQYDKNSNRKTRYASIDALLLPYLKAGGSAMMGLVRT
jgi:hypothetical protein